MSKIFPDAVCPKCLQYSQAERWLSFPFICSSDYISVRPQIVSEISDKFF